MQFNPLHQHNFKADGTNQERRVVLNCTCGWQANVSELAYRTDGENIIAMLNTLGDLASYSPANPVRVEDLIAKLEKHS